MKYSMNCLPFQNIWKLAIMSDDIPFVPENFSVYPTDIWNAEDGDDSIYQLVCFNEHPPAPQILNHRDEIFVPGKTLYFVF